MTEPAPATVRTADEATFAALLERYRRQLHVHCYRLVGSVEDADDLVQETLLGAWRGRRGFEGRSSFRTWLYRIATHACFRSLRRTPRRMTVPQVGEPVTVDSDWTDPPSVPPPAPEGVTWLGPYPDRLLEPVAPREDQPEERVVARETIELTYMAAIQHLPPRQRAILVLCHTLGWSAKDAAAVLDTSVASVNSALQRARATLQARLPGPRQDWAPEPTPTEEEWALLHRFMAAWDRADAATLVAMMREDVRWAMPPAPLWFDGRDAIAKLFEAFPIGWNGELRVVASAANRQPAMATYIRPHGGSAFELAALTVLRIEGGRISELTNFSPELLRGFGLPGTIDEITPAPR
jgi:RNA polymerase sigma-70 factor, ECF subfamily